MKKVVGLVGMPASGKSTALEIAREMGTIVVMGDIVREETINMGLEINPANLGQTARQLRETEGPQAIAKRTLQKVGKKEEEIIFIDGLRSPAEIELFRAKFDFSLVAITASDELRHKWLSLRNRADDSTKADEILARDQREIEFGVMEAIVQADFTIENNSSIESLRHNCREIFQKILNPKD